MADPTALCAPSPAVLARTAAARARVATLAAGRCARPTTLTLVAVVDGADGRLVGATQIAIPVADYLRARPDPLWGETLLG